MPRSTPILAAATGVAGMVALKEATSFVAPLLPASGASAPETLSSNMVDSALMAEAHGAPHFASGSALLSAAAVGAVCAGVAKTRKTAPKRSRVAVQSAKTDNSIKLEDFDNVCAQTGVTLNRYMLEMSRRGIVDQDIESIFNSIREASKVIGKLVNRAPLMQAELLGLQGEVNVQGEDQKKLDVITNDVLKSALQYTGKLGTLASEEEDAPVQGGNEPSTSEQILTETGKYVCVFDPLDGSSNVDAGIAVGTIFGIFKEPDDDTCEIPMDAENLSDAEAACLAGTLQPGKALVAAGYVLYSSSTELVFTVGRGCVGFTLDQGIGEFVLTRPNITIPKRGKPIYSLNEANIAEWDEPMRQYVRDIQTGKGETGEKYSLRYIGSMVGDVHRTLLYGGIFAYPADTKNQDGKLRLLYEAAPMSYIVEQAGGKSITGHSRIMDIPPVKVHQRVPIILGSADDVDECYKYYEKCDDPVLKARCEARLKGNTTAKEKAAA